MRELILAETQEIAKSHLSAGGGDKSWRWSIPDDVRRIEIPDRDEEQLPHSLRVNVDRGGAVFYIACQTAGDLVNLRRGMCPHVSVVARRRLTGSVGILFE
jgi:hypothetical protein